MNGELEKRNIDTLTGLPNKKKLMEDIEKCLEDSISGFLFILGIDNFKNINIKYGSEYGNKILNIIAESLKKNIRNDWVVYRLESDNFAVNAIGADEKETTEFYHVVRESVFEYCTLTAGVKKYDGFGDENTETVLRHAEITMDHAKKLGKNRLEFFDVTVYERQEALSELYESLRKSIINDFEGFSLRYQPQINSKNFELYGVEVLLRYNSPTLGNVTPDVFIPVLEQTSLITEVGEWVLENALKKVKIWRESIPDLKVSVNVSYVQLQADFADRVLALLEKTGVPGGALTLEVIESIELHEWTFFNKIFYKLNKKGVRISIDDFGTGYSNFSYLKNIAVNEVKIDRSFISRIQHSAYNYRLLTNMIELAHSAEIDVCCEGVETVAELVTIREVNPDLLQGFLFAKPLEAFEVENCYIDKKSKEYKAYRKQEKYYQSLSNTNNAVEEREKLSSLVDNMDEVVYVYNTSNYELLYLNSSGREVTGVYDYSGKKCYEVFAGRTSPCEECSNNDNKGNDYNVWELDNTFLKKHFLLKSKNIQWHGENANFSIAIDITEKEITSRKIEEKLEFESNIVACTKMLSEENDKKKAIDGLLASIGEFYEAERAYLFQYNNTKVHWKNTHEWCKDGIIPQIDNLQEVPFETTRRWEELFRIGESIIIDDIDDIKEESFAEWEILSMQGIKSLIVSPIWRNSKLIGFLGVDNPKKHTAYSEHVQTVASLLADRIERDETKERLNELLNLNYTDIIDKTNLGLWLISLNKEKNIYRMHADKTMKRVLGVNEDITPEECYQHWYSRVCSGYEHYFNYSVEHMIESGNLVELSYVWDHPKKGRVSVRCLGIRLFTKGDTIYLAGYYRDVDEVDMPKFLPDHESIMFEYNIASGSAYFHSSTGKLAEIETYDDNFPVSWVESEMVHPHFAKQFKTVFEYISRIDDAQKFEFMLRCEDSTYEWFKMNIHHLKDEDGRDTDTVVALLTPAKEMRNLELKFSRQKDFYKAVLSETVAYAEIDLESQHILVMGGLWKDYVNDKIRNESSYMEVLTKYKHRHVHPDDLEGFLKFISKENIEKTIQEGKKTDKYQFRRLIDGEMHWMELTAHAFIEEFSNNTYALIYMEDIDAKKKRELSHEMAATRDPLTKVYNRKAFEEEVVNHVMSTDMDGAGTLILIDVDHFKETNDTYGHIEGDNVLQKLAHTLMVTFRRKDVIGRLGGDEFVIFLKNVTDRDIINRRIQEFRTAFAEATENKSSCSIGISIIKRDKFKYNDYLKKADEALYKSKEQGRNTYNYY